MRKIILFIIPLAILAACDYLEPYPLSDQTGDELWEHAIYGEGLLSRAYANLNPGYPFWMEYLTDNAVPNTPGDNILALGGWTLETNPVGSWENCYNSIKNLNIFLEKAQDLAYRIDDSTRDSLYRSHRIGEAHFLRAWYHWVLLRDYAGVAGGEYLGIPIVNKVLGVDDEIDLPRNTYEECVEQITYDLNRALERLPLRYSGADEFTGFQNHGRGSGLAALALKARVYLNAASPAYGIPSQSKWERAAQAAHEAIEAEGGLRNLAPFGNFNSATSLDYLWIQPTWTGNSWEQQFYPPSLFGSGYCNPSQSLVDAFPAMDGYPIESSAMFDVDYPYENRDPRFSRFIFFNGQEYQGRVISIFQGGDDAPGGLTARGTRTGYYMRKLLSNNVRLTPGDQTSDIKFFVFLGLTELYLNYAEALNEAYGPNGAGPGGHTAAEVLHRVRLRGNPGLTTDSYLEEQAALGKEAFRNLIHNERRIELAFEGFRFWDMRRLNMPLNYTIKGVEVNKIGGDPVPPDNIALISEVSTSYVSPWETLEAINSGNYDIVNSSTKPPEGAYGNWPSAGLWQWVQYDFPGIYYVDRSDVYWWTDGGGIQLPDSTFIEYWDMEQNEWLEIPIPQGYGTEGDQWNTTIFSPTFTNAIRMHMKSNIESTGIFQWRVWGIHEDDVVLYTFEDVEVETHGFQEHMRYVPLPYFQTMIQNNLKQNDGW